MTATRHSRAQIRRRQRDRDPWKALGIPPDYAAHRHLPRQREARRLTAAGRTRAGRIVRLTPAAASAWRRMARTAALAGINLQLVSGFRSGRRQAQIIRGQLAHGAAIGAVLRFLAAPGYSEHHTGRAIDLGSPAAPDLHADFAATREFRWLQRNAARFGFHLSYPRRNPHRIGYEPWHWCWRAPDRPRSCAGRGGT